MKKACLGLMILCLALGVFFSAAATGQPHLTLMIYLTGSNLESDASAASDELAEMMASYPEDGSVNVIVMASGSKAWTNDAIAGDETSIYELHADRLEKVRTGPLRSMGDPDTLLSLLDYGYANHPAEQYALILWDHGAGPVMGVCFDELFTDGQGMDSLTMSELASALAASPFAGQKLQWIGFDACLMACIEVASTVAPYAEYMIASQDTEPASGWDYAFLRDIANDATAEETGRRIIDLYMESVGPTMSTITLSLIDLSAIPAAEEEMNAFFASLSETVSVDSYARLTACRMDTKRLACSSPTSYDLVDLLDLLDVYQDAGVADCGALTARLGQAIVYNRANMPFINGLSLYYPYDNKDEYLSSWGRRAADNAFSSGYQTYLQGVTSIWLGDALADWNTGLYMESSSSAGSTVVSMQLTDNQATHYGGALLYVLEESAPNEYRFIYMTDDVPLTQENRLETIYTGQALCMVDENGEALTGALTYLVRDDTIFLPAMISRGSGIDWEFMDAYLAYRQNERGEYELLEIIGMDGDLALQGRSTIQLEDWDDFGFIGPNLSPAYDEQGRLLKYGSWSSSSSLNGHSLSVGSLPWHPAFIEQYDGRPRVALLQIYDDQNNVAHVEMLPIENPNISAITVASQVLVDNEVCRVSLVGAELITGSEAGVRLILHFENRAEMKLDLSFQQIAVDGTVLDDVSSHHWLDPESTNIAIRLPGDALQRAHLSGAQQFSMILTVKDADAAWGSDALVEERFAINAPMELSPIFSPADDVLLGQADWRGLQVELIGLYLDEDAALCGQLHVVNPTQEPRALKKDRAYINSIECSVSMNSATLLPEQETYLDFRINTREQNGSVWPDPVSCPLEHLGVTEITELAFDLWEDAFEDRQRVTFLLPDPVAYPAGAAADWPVLYDKNGVTISVIEGCTYPEQSKRSFFFCVRNDTDRELSIRDMPYFRTVDGPVAREGYVLNGTVPAHAIHPIEYRLSLTDAVPMPTTFGSFETTVTVLDHAGRFDLLHLRLEPLGEPVEAVFPDLLGTTQAWVYAPDQLRVTASVQPPATSQPALLEALGDPDSWPVLFDQDGLTLSLMGICVYPEDDLRNTSHILYLAARNERETTVELSCLLGLENGESAPYFYMVPSLAMSILSQVRPGADTVQEIFLSMGDSPAAIEVDSLAGAIAIIDDGTSYTLIFAALPTAEPLFLERVSDEWPGPCYVYGSDRLDVRVSVEEDASP